MVSVQDSGAVGTGFKSQPRRCLRQTVHTRRVSVHQAAKLVADLLRVVGVTAGLAESNGSLPSSRLPVLSVRPAVTSATLKRAATNFAAW